MIQHYLTMVTLAIKNSIKYLSITNNKNNTILNVQAFELIIVADNFLILVSKLNVSVALVANKPNNSLYLYFKTKPYSRTLQCDLVNQGLTLTFIKGVCELDGKTFDTLYNRLKML